MKPSLNSVLPIPSISNFCMHENRKRTWSMAAHTKGFDPTSGPSTLILDGDEDDMPKLPNPSLDIPGSSVPPSSIGGFTFTEDHYNLLNGEVDLLTSSADKLGWMLHQLQVK